MSAPLAAFPAERYLIDLRDRTAGAPEGSPRHLAHIWALGLLDVRFDCLLIPVLVSAAGLPLVPTLRRLNRERDWGLPEDYFPSRLEQGGCLLFLESAPEVAQLYPRCPCAPPA